MDIQIARSVLKVIREEALRRDSADRDPYFADEQWLADRAFVNELCLMLLVALWHQIERELVLMGARASQGDADLSPADYQRALDALRKGLGIDWPKLRKLLNVATPPPEMWALQRLANAYKHDPTTGPSDELISHLGLTTTVNYNSLPESDALRQGLAACVGLDKYAGYVAITEAFINAAEVFLDDIRRNAKLGRVLWGPVSFLPEDALH